MSAGTARIASSILAVWAVLFAPGAATGPDGETPPATSEWIAGAVMAPTFATDSLPNRSCRTDDHPVDPEWSGEQVSSVAVPPALGATHPSHAVHPGCRRSQDLLGRNGHSSRAPPRN